MLLWTIIIISCSSFLRIRGGTYLYKTIFKAINAHGKIILCVASTGIAAQSLPEGRLRTLVSKFRLVVIQVCGQKTKSHLAALLRQVHAII